MLKPKLFGGPSAWFLFFGQVFNSFTASVTIGKIRKIVLRETLNQGKGFWGKGKHSLKICELNAFGNRNKKEKNRH